MKESETSPWFPVIDLSLLEQGDLARDRLIAQLDWTCREFGFFHLVGHGIDGHCIDFLTGRKPDLHKSVGDHEAALTVLGRRLLGALAESSSVEDDFVAAHYTRNPSVQFKISNGPASPDSCRNGLGDNTGADQGVLTLLKQGPTTGLQVRYGQRWIAVPEVSDALVCIVGDTLQNLTYGQYVSVAHRFEPLRDCGGLSMTLFVEPDFDPQVIPWPGAQAAHHQPIDQRRN